MSDGVNDDDLNKMIAGLQNGQPAAPTVSAPAAPLTAPTTSTIPVITTDHKQQQPVPVATNPATINPQLSNIKQDALNELRPLVDKLDLPPEEKFDTLLLLIRSTDDSSLVPAAHAAAKQIADEARRAQALLDIIKEIDFFGQNSAK